MQLSFFTVSIPRADFTLSEHFNAPEEVASERALVFFESIKEEVRAAVTDRMRDGGRGGGADTERGNLQVLTIGGDNPSLVAFGDTFQAFADEFGRVPGHFPPWKAGSELFDWTERHGFGVLLGHGFGVLLESQVRALGALQGKGTRKREAADQAKRIESISFLIARAIYTRGLPAPDDYLHEPFAQTFSEFLPEVSEGLLHAGFETAQILNGMGVY